MTKFIAILMALALLFSMSSCGSKPEGVPEPEGTPIPSPDGEIEREPEPEEYPETVIVPGAEPDEPEEPFESHFLCSPLDPEHDLISLAYQEGHEAVDLSATKGASIYAVLPGTVEKVVREEDAYSKYVIVDHHNGWRTLYAVCDSITVEEGDEVEAGQEVAKVGTTGNVTGPTLHFELRDTNNNKLDPTPYLEEVLGQKN